MTPPRILIIDDHPLVCDALEDRLRDALGDLDLAYSGGLLADALAVARSSRVDCAVLDLDLGDGRPPAHNAADLVAAGCPVLVVSAMADPATVRSCLQVGALGYVSKQSPTDELVEAVRTTLRGEPFTSRDIAACIYADPGSVVQLSEREREAMVLYASGMKIDTVARRMGVKPTTAGEYIKRVRSKYLRAGTPLPTKTDLYRQARVEGLVS